MIHLLLALPARAVSGAASVYVLWRLATTSDGELGADWTEADWSAYRDPTV